jgi:hypothetical protein
MQTIRCWFPSSRGKHVRACSPLYVRILYLTNKLSHNTLPPSLISSSNSEMNPKCFLGDLSTAGLVEKWWEFEGRVIILLYPRANVCKAALKLGG